MNKITLLSLMLRKFFKPFKRWAFKRANNYTFYYINLYNKKYIVKYLKKIKKISILKKNNNQIELIEKLNNIEFIDILNNNNYKNIEDTLNLINSYLVNNSDIVNLYDYQIIYNYSLYIYNLKEINKKDFGLDHSKVREYWLKRGPRIFIASFILLIANYILYIYFKELDRNTNYYLILINIIALLLSLYMLYYRLPDSIESAVARTTHDYYVKYKKTELYKV
jgi:hypothetical protein